MNIKRAPLEVNEFLTLVVLCLIFNIFFYVYIYVHIYYVCALYNLRTLFTLVLLQAHVSIHFLLIIMSMNIYLSLSLKRCFIHWSFIWLAS